ncbi:MAG: hypothetical protein V1892_01455 [bacterium]
MMNKRDAEAKIGKFSHEDCLSPAKGGASSTEENLLILAKLIT